MSGLISTADAAVRLALTPRQVRNLVAAGALRQVARGVLDATSVDRLDTVPRSGRQAWAPATAWAAIALLSGHGADGIGPSQASRLRGRLRDMTPEQLVERTRRRATVTRYSGHRSVLPRVADQLIVPVRDRLGLAAVPQEARVDGYVDAHGVDSLVRELALRVDDDGPITLRATAADLDVVRDLSRDRVLAAVDLSTSLDPRERGAGLAAVREALEAFARG